jgi:Rrf2 family nitric oxide-sensitive transcriptional repressor
MQLTLHTDYALRVLIYLRLKGDSLATISEIADFYQISRNHLVKVVHQLASHGFIHTTRGKHGGMRLARSADLISVGEVVRKMEPNFNVVECFSAANRPCAVVSLCALKSLLYRGMNDFLASLDRFTLADAVISQQDRAGTAFPVKVSVEKPASGA